MKNKLQVFVKFVLVGVINTLFGTTIMLVFYNIFHLNYWISSASNYFFGSILSYFLNKYFTFQNNESTLTTGIRFIINILFCYIISYGLAKPLVKVVLSYQPKNIQENYAMVIGMIVFIFINYIGQHYFVFKNNNEN